MSDPCDSCALRGKACPTPTNGLIMHGESWDCAHHVRPLAAQVSLELDMLMHPWRNDDDVRSYCGGRRANA